ncbi:TetR/AcrR family transcriptional regulator [Streptomyces hoynatensis]|nr:TetR/AcrR family transcriptional regulator C-terminal ligand-binding domain-containing protein [Streptomyces hoynatensis]
MNSTATAPAASGRPGTRRRGNALRSAILEAALAQLRECGYAALTMDGVAAAAGTGKAALYRRWENKEALVVDALASALPAPGDYVLTGDHRADIRALLCGIRDAFALSQDAAFRAAKKNLSAGVVALIQERVVLPSRARILDIIRTGIDSGEFRPGAANDRAAAAGPAMLVFSFVTDGPEVPDEYVDQIVDDVVLPLVRA